MAAKGSPFQKLDLQEIEQRAYIFLGLKHSREHARARILQNLRWEFNVSLSAAIEKKVDEIINRVYAR